MLSTMKRLDFAGWIYSLVSAFIGGGAGAIVSSVSVTMLDPTGDFKGMAMLKLIGVTFFFSGLLNLAFALKASPVPPLIEVQTTTTATTTTATKGGTTTSTVEQKVTEVKPEAK